MSRYWILSSVFSVSIDITMWLFFSLLIWWISWFLNIELIFIPGINWTWSWCILPFMYCWILFANILRIFTSVFMKNFFSFLSLSGFCISVIAVSESKLPSVLSSSVSWKRLYRIGVNSLKVWYNSLVKLSELGYISFGNFKIANSVYLILIRYTN